MHADCLIPAGPVQFRKTGLMYGEMVPVADAGQLNAYMTLKHFAAGGQGTDPADNDTPDDGRARDWARPMGAYFETDLANLSGAVLHGIQAPSIVGRRRSVVRSHGEP